MTSILDQFKKPPISFVPKTHQEALALRLSQKLGDGRAAASYAALLAEFSEGQLLTAYHRTVSSGVHHDLGSRFRTELKRTHSGTTHTSKGYNLLALRVERRAVAAAVFCGDHLEFAQVRHLASVKGRALASADGFICWLLAHLPVDSAAIEAIEGDQEIHRRTVYETVSQALQDQMLPIWTVPKRDLLASFGIPPLRGRAELRRVIADIWPVLSESRPQMFVQDAVALGLHVQIERQFIH